jgi:hypothetical protein
MVRGERNGRFNRMDVLHGLELVDDCSPISRDRGIAPKLKTPAKGQPPIMLGWLGSTVHQSD